MAGMDFYQLANRTEAQLETILRRSGAPELDALAGSEWRGLNTGFLPGVLKIRKFIKGFFRQADIVEGYNVLAAQNGVQEEWIDATPPGKERRFGFYTVTPAVLSNRDRRYPAALLLDYGASKSNPRVSPIRVIRDYLAQPDPACPDILLGKAYLALGPLRVASNYFLLSRFS
jgi:hypothetical protein